MIIGTGVVVVGVGGQGSVFIARVLGEAALRARVSVVASELHGMAQRGGVVHSALVFGGAEGAIIPPGEADLLIALEPLEALRALQSLRKGGAAVVSTSPIVPFTVSQGGPPYPEVGGALEHIARWAGPLVAADFTALAIEAGERRAVSAAVLGAVDALALLPFPDGLLEEVLSAMAPSKKREQNMAAFAAGRAATRSSHVS